MASSTKEIVESYLVSSARLGNRAAQSELVGQYQSRLLRHAYRLLRDTEQAKDAVQDGWVEIIRGLSKLRDESAFRPWAYRLITRRCAKIIAGQKKNREIAQRVTRDPAIDSESAEIQEFSTELGSLRKALETLPPEHSSVVALFYLEEMSVAEAAVALDVPIGTVKSRLLNARKKLRDSLERR